MDTKKSNRRKNVLSLAGLFLFFLAPVLISYYLLNTQEGSTKHKNNGDLITPIRPLAAIDLHDIYNNSAVPLKGKWSLVFLNRGVCQQECKENLYKIRQIRLATGKHVNRVQRVVVMDDVNESLYKDALTEDYNGQLILSLAEVEDGFSDAFKLEQDEDPFIKNRIYIVDPLGNLMMSYEADADPIGIIKDMKVLIRASRIG